MQYMIGSRETSNEKARILRKRIESTDSDEFDEVYFGSHSGYLKGALRGGTSTRDKLRREIFTDKEEFERESPIVRDEHDVFDYKASLDSLSLRVPDRLYIFTYGSYDSSGGRAPTNVVTLNGKEYGLEGSEGDARATGSADLQEVRDEEGYLIGKRVGPIVIIFFDLSHSVGLSSEANSEILADLFTHILKEVEENESEFSSMKEIGKYFFRQRVKSQINQKRDEVKEKKKTKEVSIESWMDHIRDAKRKIIEWNKLLNSDEEDVDIDEMISNIEDNVMIEDVSIDEGGLKSRTKEIECANCNIGKYNIIIKPEGDIRIKHMPEISGSQHPHVSSGGIPCWGNYSSITEHVSKVDYDVVVDIALTFLQSYSPDTGPHIALDDFLQNHEDELIE